MGGDALAKKQIFIGMTAIVIPFSYSIFDNQFYK